MSRPSDAGLDPVAGRTILDAEPLRSPAAAVRQLRQRQPEAALERSEQRQRSTAWPEPLLLAAGDHPARLLTGWRGEPLAVADRGRYLRTLVGLLASRAVDGIEATPDVIEELLYLDNLVVGAGQLSFLDGRLLIGTVNRAGLAGTRFELLDRASGFTAESARALRLDGVKWMFRLAPGEIDTAEQLRALIAGLDQAYQARLPVMLELEWVERDQAGGWRYRSNEPELLAGLVGVASGLGPSTINRYLELPRSEALGPAIRATTLPVCALPPERRAAGPEAVHDYATLPELPLRGQLLGRDIMLADEPVPLAMAVALAWRQGLSTGAALARATEWWAGPASGQGS